MSTKHHTPSEPAPEFAGIPDTKEDNLTKLLQDNLKWSQVIYQQNKRMNTRLTLMVVGNYIRLLIILAPIILGIIYLPDLIERFWSNFQTVTGGSGNQIPVSELYTLFQQFFQESGSALPSNALSPEQLEFLRSLSR